MSQSRASKSVLLMGSALSLTLVALGCSAPSHDPVDQTTEDLSAVTAAPRVETWAHYYPWWRGTRSGNWPGDLGSVYVSTSAYPAKPAHLVPGTCTWSSDTRFPGNRLLDVPASPDGLYDEASDATLQRQLADATTAGLTGFVVSWHGDGTTTQTPATNGTFNVVLEAMARNVVTWNAAHPTKKFQLAIGIESKNWSTGGADSVARSETAMINDIEYLTKHYLSASAPYRSAFALSRYAGRAMLVWLDSGRKNNAGQFIWSLGAMRATLGGLSARTQLEVLGDERGLAVWHRADSPDTGLRTKNIFDGNTWYWSSENPTSGTAQSLAALGAAVVADGKAWYPPATPGFNVQLLGTGHTCVPRASSTSPTATLDATFAMARASSPKAAGVMIVSWNEYGENTYIEPSVVYGTQFRDACARLVAGP